MQPHERNDGKDYQPCWAVTLQLWGHLETASANTQSFGKDPISDVSPATDMVFGQGEVRRAPTPPLTEEDGYNPACQSAKCVYDTASIWLFVSGRTDKPTSPPPIFPAVFSVPATCPLTRRTPL